MGPSVIKFVHEKTSTPMRHRLNGPSAGVERKASKSYKPIEANATAVAPTAPAISFASLDRRMDLAPAQSSVLSSCQTSQMTNAGRTTRRIRTLQSHTRAACDASGTSSSLSLRGLASSSVGIGAFYSTSIRTSGFHNNGLISAAIFRPKVRHAGWLLHCSASSSWDCAM